MSKLERERTGKPLDKQALAAAVASSAASIFCCLQSGPKMGDYPYLLCCSGPFVLLTGYFAIEFFRGGLKGAPIKNGGSAGGGHWGGSEGPGASGEAPGGSGGGDGWSSSGESFSSGGGDGWGGGELGVGSSGGGDGWGGGSGAEGLGGGGYN